MCFCLHGNNGDKSHSLGLCRAYFYRTMVIPLYVFIQFIPFKVLLHLLLRFRTGSLFIFLDTSYKNVTGFVVN